MNSNSTPQHPWHWSRALWKIAVGLAWVWALFHFDIPTRLDAWWEATIGRDTFIGYRGNVLVYAGLSLPVVLAIAGLLELGLRQPFWRIAASWDTLPEWVQGLLCVVFTVGAVGLVMLIAGVW